MYHILQNILAKKQNWNFLNWKLKRIDHGFYYLEDGFEWFFLVVITKHMNEFNLKLQNQDVFICDIYTFVKAMEQKLILFETQISKNCFTHFMICDK